MSTLLVASAGGHLMQLHSLRPRLDGIDDDVTWVTFDSPQSRSLLAGEHVIFAHDQPPRDYRSLARNTVAAFDILRRRRFGSAVSTGAGFALAFLPLAEAMRIHSHYIESATRAEGPSLTGGLLRRVPRISLYSQYESWAHGRWAYRGSVFDAYAARESGRHAVGRAVVTVGTLDCFPFPRLVSRAAAVLSPDVATVWQTGSTQCDELPIIGHRSMPSAALQDAMREADVVIAHAGTGSAITALEAGRCPVLVPRRAAHGEHVDDHQFHLARELDRRGLAIACEAEELSLAVLERAAARTVVRAENVPRFGLW